MHYVEHFENHNGRPISTAPVDAEEMFNLSCQLISIVMDQYIDRVGSPMMETMESGPTGRLLVKEKIWRHVRDHLEDAFVHNFQSETERARQIVYGLMDEGYVAKRLLREKPDIAVPAPNNRTNGSDCEPQQISFGNHASEQDTHVAGQAATYTSR